MKNLLTLYSVHGTFNGCNMLFIFLFPFPPVSSHRFYILIGWNFFSKILDLVPEGYSFTPHTVVQNDKNVV